MRPGCRAVAEPGSARITRRTVLGGLAVPWLAACSTPLPLIPAPAPERDAVRLLNESAEAHGLPAYRQMNDINVSYAGQWRALVGRIQPEVTDTGFRGRSQERLMPKAGVVAQSYLGERGRKQVWWKHGRSARDDAGEVAVWFNGERSSDPAAQQAAALVAEGYGLFLLGPLWIVDRHLPMSRAGTENVDGRACDVIDMWMSPGLGAAPVDRVALCIDRRDRLTRRMRFTLEGFANTQGAVAEVDTFEHQQRFGVTWPMRSFERVVHPLPLPAHDWHVTGLDVNRGYPASALAGPEFAGDAAMPARVV